jgi:sec-independent protein translocase protein TatC
MTVIEHLEELRYRLIVSIFAILVGAIIAYFLYPRIIDILKAPLDKAGRIGDVTVSDLYVAGLTTAFVFRMKVSAFAGLIFALPVTLYQLWRFITPGLERRERRYSFPFVVSALVLFAFGGLVAFYLMPAGIRFLLGFVPPAKPLIHLNEYLNFVMLMVIAFGISFEFPLVLVFLGAAGILSSQQLRSKRRVAVFAAFVVGAVATPSADPLSQTLLALPLYILYEVAILVVRFALKR